MRYRLRTLLIEGTTMFRFTVRELVLLTVVVALAMGWWLDRRRIQQDRDIWKFHAEGARLLAQAGVTKMEFYGKLMIARQPSDKGTFSREWPHGMWYHDQPGVDPPGHGPRQHPQ